MEVAVEIEDDSLFADLRKQISLLIMDDDDQDPRTRYPSVSFQAFSGRDYSIQASSRGYYSITAQSPVLYEQSCRRGQSKGTGVFIPQSSLGRSKQRHGRFNSSNTKPSYRHQDNNNNSRMVSYQAPRYSNSFNTAGNAN